MRDDADRRLTIFVPHGSMLLTDGALHGDGLVQWGFLRELARRGHRLLVATPRAELTTPALENIEVFEIAGPGRTMLPLARYVVRAHALYRRLRAKERIDVIHQMNPVVRGVTLAWPISPEPVVLGTYVGDWPHEEPLRRLRGGSPSVRARMMLKLALDATAQARASLLLLTTPFARNRVPFAASLERKIVYLHHGIDTDVYSPQPRDDDPEARPCSVLYLGLLEPHKGLRTLLDAFESLLKIVPRARLIVAGVGALGDEIAARAERGGWNDRLEMLGRLPHSDVPGWLRATSVLCAPSFGEPYGQGVVEAFACGRPVVATAAGGVKYLLEPEGGLSFTPGDSEALAAALATILGDPAAARRMGIFNRALAVERHSWERVGDALERAYRRALLGPSSRPVASKNRRAVGIGP